MIKRALKTYLSIILLMGVGYVITSCQREDNLFPQETDFPILVHASSEWPVIPKSPIEDESDLAGDGVVVWANNDISVNVFGQYGTKVYYVAGGNWTYSPTRYWQMANYTFAAVAPASYFAPSYKNVGDSQNGSLRGFMETDNSLTIDFGETGFDLNSTQADMMYTFENVDNLSGEGMGVVNIDLNHMFALLNIDFTSDTPDKSFSIESITIYGNHKSVKGNLTLNGSAGDVETLRGRLWNITTVGDCYAQYNRPGSENGAWDITSNIQSRLVEKLIVFPENLASNPLHVKVVYNGGQERVINLTNEWQMGKVYTYLLAVDGIEINDPIVTDWTTGENFDIPIQ